MVGTAETPFDLRFRALGIPVRVHPFFWLIAAMLGWRDQNLPVVGLWVVCVFVSILVHEYGHGLMAKRFRESPSILLWGMGGLCYSQGERQTPMERLLVILAGPGAGFLLALVVMILATLFRGITPDEHLGLVSTLLGVGHGSLGAFEKMHNIWELFAYYFLLEINIMWGLLNLLPIWPLDGGQAAQIVLTWFDRARGRRWGHIVSLMVAGILAVTAGMGGEQIYLAIFFGYFAFLNYQMLQTLHQQHLFGIERDDW